MMQLMMVMVIRMKPDDIEDERGMVFQQLLYPMTITNGELEAKADVKERKRIEFKM